MFEFVFDILNYLFCIKKYKCYECEQKFNTKNKLINHITLIHKNYYYDTNNDKFYNSIV
jgi:hypothetical protein